MPGLRRAGISLGVVALSACTPYNFPDEVAAFDTGVKTLRSAYVDGMAQGDRDLADRYRWGWITDPSAVVNLTASCEEDLASPTPLAPGEPPKSCELFQAGAIPPGEALFRADVPQVFPTANDAYNFYKGIDQKTRAGLDGLADYAAALRRITDATDRGTLIAAQDKMEASLGNIAQAAGVPFAAAVVPVASLFNRLIVISLDQRRYAALESATRRIDPALQGLTEALINGLDRARNRRHDELNRLAITLTAALKGKSWTERQALIDELQTVAEQIEALRRSNPAATVQKLIDAHHDLTVAVARTQGAPDLATVLAQVQGFAQDAGALSDALKSQQ